MGIERDNEARMIFRKEHQHCTQCHCVTEKSGRCPYCDSTEVNPFNLNPRGEEILSQKLTRRVFSNALLNIQVAIEKEINSGKITREMSRDNNQVVFLIMSMCQTLLPKHPEKPA